MQDGCLASSKTESGPKSKVKLRRGEFGSVGSIKFIRSPISCFIDGGWEPTDGADKPENFSSIAGSFNIAPSGTSLKNYKVEIKRRKISCSLKMKLC